MTVAIRNAIQRNTDEVLTKERQRRSDSTGGRGDPSQNQKKDEDHLKKIKQAIQDGQTQALECRVKVLEELLLDLAARL